MNTVPTPRHALPPGPPHATPARRRLRARGVLLLAALAALGAGVTALGPQRIADVAGALFQAYVDAQQRMLAAAGNVTADGRSEFAVLLRDGVSAADLQRAIAGIDGVRFERAADLSGWAIVTAAAGDRRGLDALMARPEARLVVPNRGLWICH